MYTYGCMYVYKMKYLYVSNKLKTCNFDKIVYVTSNFIKFCYKTYFKYSDNDQNI